MRSLGHFGFSFGNTQTNHTQHPFIFGHSLISPSLRLLYLPVCLSLSLLIHAEMSALPREVWRWLQSLQLSVQVRNIRRDIANGYVIAEILSRYFPTKVSMLYEQSEEESG